MTILEAAVLAVVGGSLVLLGARMGLLHRLHTAVNELAGVATLMSKTGDRMEHGQAQHQRRISGDVAALSGSIGSVQERVEYVATRIPDAAMREAEFLRWAARVRTLAGQAATPGKALDYIPYRLADPKPAVKDLAAKVKALAVPKRPLPAGTRARKAPTRTERPRARRRALGK